MSPARCAAYRSSSILLCVFLSHFLSPRVLLCMLVSFSQCAVNWICFGPHVCWLLHFKLGFTNASVLCAQMNMYSEEKELDYWLQVRRLQNRAKALPYLLLFVAPALFWLFGCHPVESDASLQHNGKVSEVVSPWPQVHIGWSNLLQTVARSVAAFPEHCIATTPSVPSPLPLRRHSFHPSFSKQAAHCTAVFKFVSSKNLWVESCTRPLQVLGDQIPTVVEKAVASEQHTDGAGFDGESLDDRPGGAQSEKASPADMGRSKPVRRESINCKNVEGCDTLPSMFLM